MNNSFVERGIMKILEKIRYLVTKIADKKDPSKPNPRGKRLIKRERLQHSNTLSGPNYQEHEQTKRRLITPFEKGVRKLPNGEHQPERLTRGTARAPFAPNSQRGAASSCSTRVRLTHPTKRYNNQLKECNLTKREHLNRLPNGINSDV